MSKEYDDWCYYSGMPSPNAYNKTKMIDLKELQNQWYNQYLDENGFHPIDLPIVRRELSEEKKEKVSKEFNIDKILLDPDYAKSLGIVVYVRVEDNGDKYAILNNGQEEVELKLNQNKDE